MTLFAVPERNQNVHASARSAIGPNAEANVARGMRAGLGANALSSLAWHAAQTGAPFAGESSGASCSLSPQRHGGIAFAR